MSRMGRDHETEPHDHPHADDELHGGTVADADPPGAHRHPHGHASGHPHEHDHAHAHRHAHEHVHADGTRHAHPHVHTHAHPHGHDAHHHHAHEDPHAHDAPHHHHADLAAEIGGIVARAGATAVLVREVPGADAGAALAALELVGGPPALTASAARRVAGLRLPGPFGRGLDAHALLHALEHQAPPRGGLLFLHAPAFGLAGPRLAAQTILAVGIAAAVDLADDHPDLLAGVSLILVTQSELAGKHGLNVDAVTASLKDRAPGVAVIAVSARTLDGLDRLCAWLKAAQALAMAGG